MTKHERVTLRATEDGFLFTADGTSMLVTWKAANGFTSFLERMASVRKRLIMSRAAFNRAGRFDELREEERENIRRLERILRTETYTAYQSAVNRDNKA